MKHITALSHYLTVPIKTHFTMKFSKYIKNLLSFLFSSSFCSILLLVFFSHRNMCSRFAVALFQFIYVWQKKCTTEKEHKKSVFSYFFIAFVPIRCWHVLVGILSGFYWKLSKFSKFIFSKILKVFVKLILKNWHKITAKTSNCFIVRIFLFYIFCLSCCFVTKTHEFYSFCIYRCLLDTHHQMKICTPKEEVESVLRAAAKQPKKRTS